MSRRKQKRQISSRDWAETLSVNQNYSCLFLRTESGWRDKCLVRQIKTALIPSRSVDYWLSLHLWALPFEVCHWRLQTVTLDAVRSITPPFPGEVKGSGVRHQTPPKHFQLISHLLKILNYFIILCVVKTRDHLQMVVIRFWLIHSLISKQVRKPDKLSGFKDLISHQNI